MCDQNTKRVCIKAVDKESTHNIRYFGNAAITSQHGPVSRLINESIRVYDAIEAES